MSGRGFGILAEEVAAIVRELGLPDRSGPLGFDLGYHGSERFRLQRGSGIAGRGNLWALVEVHRGEQVGHSCEKPSELRRVLLEWMAGPRPSQTAYARRHRNRFGDSVIWVERR